MPNITTSVKTLYGFRTDNMAMFIPMVEAQQRYDEHQRAIDDLVEARQDIATRDGTITKLSDDVLRLENILDSLRNLLQLGETDNPVNAVGAIVTERDNLRAEFEKLQRAYEVLSTDSAACLDENKRLSARIAELEKPPVIVEPEKPPVTEPAAFEAEVSRAGIHNAIIGCIVKDNTPTEPQNEITRQSIDLAAEAHCNMVTFFLNIEEVKEHLRNIGDGKNNLVRYAKSLNLRYGADSVDVIVARTPEAPDEPILTPYFEGLIKLGAEFVIFNDADGVIKETGLRRYPPDMLRKMVTRVRVALRNHQNIPIVASLTANADPATYKALGFDLVEAQTFGSTANLKSFLERGFDIYCIDTQVSSSVSELLSDRPVLLASKATAIRLYAIFDYDGAGRPKTDWRRMAVQVKEITETNRLFIEKRTQNRANP